MRPAPLNRSERKKELIDWREIDDKASGAKQTNLITKARRGILKVSHSMFFFEQICERKSGLTLQNILKYFNLLEGQVILKNEK